jgi:excinuclease UvrABC ATPase subunit
MSPVLDCILAMFIASMSCLENCATKAFSFNSKGACESCNGSGVVYTDLAYLAEFKSPCEVCQGRRFKFVPDVPRKRTD